MPNHNGSLFTAKQNANCRTGTTYCFTSCWKY